MTASDHHTRWRAEYQHSRWRTAFKVAAVLALLIPIAAAAAFSFLPAKRYEGTVWMILDASRTGQTGLGAEDRRLGNEIVTYDQLLRTQLTIAGSDEVVIRAVQALRPARLYPDIPAQEGDGAALDRAEAAAARGSMVLSLEPNTFVFKLGFRHPDPFMAARFANLLAQEFQARRSALYSNSGDVDFFRGQETRFRDELRSASAALEAFGRRSSIYSVPEQRKLLLDRRSFAAKDVDDNATQIARTESEVNSIKTQILALRTRMTLPPEIFGDMPKNAVPRPARAGDMLGDDPPLLNVRIYQDLAAKLVERNSELDSARATRAKRTESIQQIDADLQALAANEATYNALRRAVDQAEAAIDSLSKRASEARVNNAWRSNEAFSSAQILQSATIPSAPVFPRPIIFLPAGLIAGIFLSLVIIFLGRRLGFLSIPLVPTILLNDQPPTARESAGSLGQPVRVA